VLAQDVAAGPLRRGHVLFCFSLVLSMPSELDLTHLYASMSAACRTGYVKSPAFNKESSTSDSSLAFLETANRVCESCSVMVEGACAKAKHLPRRHPLQLSDRCQTVQDPSEFDMVPDLFDTSVENPVETARCGISHLILMENNRSLGIYTRRKYERHHSCPRL
jgi:hypothetical protein